MPPLAAAATAIRATAAVGVGALAAYAPAIAAGTGIFGAYTTYKSTKQAEKARSTAEHFRQEELRFAEKQAGEYYELSQQQMELQAQASQITTLANLIAAKRQPAQQEVFATPAAKQYSVIDRLNQAIGNLFTVAA